MTKSPNSSIRLFHPFIANMTSPRMMISGLLCLIAIASFASVATADGLSPHRLRCEYLENPQGIDAAKPRLCWQLRADDRNQKQAAYRLLVASSPQRLAADEGDLWDTGKVSSDQTLHVVYQGKPLASGTACYWKVQVWAEDSDAPSPWSPQARWSMGLLNESDWTAQYISIRDPSPISKDVQKLDLPPARQYRKEFSAEKKIARATVYATALGIYELHLNGKRVSDHYFAPGWTDYRQRAYYNTFDVTDQVRQGDNAIGVWVADGWYSGYVGFGLLTGMGTEKTGRCTYGKTPSVMLQMEIEYDDGSRQTVGTDTTWKVTQQGPIQVADLLMGEEYDARKSMPGWASAGFDDSQWQTAILAADNGNPQAMFYEGRNPTAPGRGPQIEPSPRDLGFIRPKLQAFPGVPVRITQQLPARSVTPRGEDTYLFDLGQNFAGVVRLKVKGPAGQRIRIRYGEMLHQDGRLMTENLRKARATDYYTCSGDPEGEVYQPRFTFHGFQYVEVSNFPGQPTRETVSGLVMHSDTPLVSTFECSDPMVNQLFSNVVWTQRANFLDLPTDCPQRDERMGWTGDAQAYVATAAYNADIGAFYTKWLRELMESQRPSGAFPGYAPFPFQHGWDFGSAWADAGVICPWTIWQAYGDTQVIKDCWEPMTRFMQWRERTSVGDLGIAHGNAWGDWLAQGASTPLDFVDTVYLAISARMMSEMAEAIGQDEQAKHYRQQFERTQAAFAKKYLSADGIVNINTQTAQTLALFANLVPEAQRQATAAHLAKMIADNGNRMSTGFLGTRPLLPVLSSAGQHSLATFLLQSREFPSWGYEISNGATTIWERWDSYTKEDGFGRHNAAMNSFSHYAFGAVCEWMFHTLAGIQSDGPGYKRIIIHPHLPAPASNAMHQPIDWVDASYDSIRGTIASRWRLEQGRFYLNVTIPAGTSAKVYLPHTLSQSVTEGGQPIDQHPEIQRLPNDGPSTVLAVGSGQYRFEATSNLQPAATALKITDPKDTSINPENIDLTGATKLVSWDFRQADDIASWGQRNHCEIKVRDGKTFLVATGPDPQIATDLESEVSGQLVVALRAHPGKGASSQFFWASKQAGFNAGQQSQRMLMPTKQANNYLFAITNPGDANPVRIGKLRFDPFATFDAHADRGQMEIESITIYALPGPTKNEDDSSKETSMNDRPLRASPEPSEASDKRKRSRFPNVLFVLSEDQGAHLGLLGTPGLQTPHLDALCRSGTYFQQAFVAYPVCSASKAALYTGLHSHTNGILNNTHNFHKPASQLTAAERNAPLAQNNRILDRWVTLTEILHDGGYYQGVTHKLHVLPNRKFPYDEFLSGDQAQITQFWKRANQSAKPWFLMLNIPHSHRPYPNSDKQPIRVDPGQVALPGYLPDTPLVRQDWAEYLAGIEQVDTIVGQTLAALRATGQHDNTIIVYMSDHGPTFQHGKMTLHDLGLRVPLAIAGPGIAAGVRSDALVSELDLLPTLLDVIENHAKQPLAIPGSRSDRLDYPLHGISLAPLLVRSDAHGGDAHGGEARGGHEFIFAEISNRGPLPNDGIQERCVYDGRWKLIYRENVDRAWRQVNADSRQFKTWGNRTYAETIRVKDQFPQAYRILAEMDPQNLAGAVPAIELYDLNSDPDELHNLANQAAQATHQGRLLQALANWKRETNDTAIQLSLVSQ